MRKQLITILGCVWAAAATAQMSCDNLHGKICLEAVQENGAVTLFAENRYPLATVSLALKIDLDNLALRRGSKGPFVLEGGERMELARFEAVRNAAWSYNYTYFWNRGDYRVQHDASYVYKLPYATGQAFTVVQGCDGTFTHKGQARYAIDFEMPEGTPIHAAREGVVVDLLDEYDVGGPDESFRNYGNYIVIEHSDGTMAQYFHLKKGGARVKLGQKVARGEPIGLSGNTGLSGGPHLHFDVIRGKAGGTESETLRVMFETERGTLSCPRVNARPRRP